MIPAPHRVTEKERVPASHAQYRADRGHSRNGRESSPCCVAQVLWILAYAGGGVFPISHGQRLPIPDAIKTATPPPGPAVYWTKEGEP